MTFDTCEIIEERWANWMRHDPIGGVESEGENLRSLKAPYIDCGEKDQWSSGSGSDEPMCSGQAGGRGTVQDHLKRSTYIYKTTAGGIAGWRTES